MTPLIRPEDRCNLDSQLSNWYTNLPWLLRTTDPCAEPLYIARCIMKWRYQNLRMLLHRPVLLTMASNGMASSVAEQDIAAVETCREMAKATIEDIAGEWTRNQMSGWNAVWFLYQAAMIPLVSIFWEWNSPQVGEWQKQIETILELLDAMEDWSLAARRSREVVWRMYEASRQLSVMRGDAAAAATTGVTTPSIPTDPALLIGTDSEFHLSPIGLETDEMIGMLGQQGIWDLDGMYWGQAQGPLPHDTTAATMCDIDENMMAMDYASMGHQGSMIDSSLWVQ
jgi:hypothetical protein